MALLTPFSYPFKSPIGANIDIINIRKHSLLRSLTVAIVDDNAGPILVNVYVEVEGQKHQLGQPTGIYDGSGDNAKRFTWTRSLPLSRALPNKLTIQHTNHSGSAIEIIRVSGSVQR